MRRSSQFETLGVSNKVSTFARRLGHENRSSSLDANEFTFDGIINTYEFAKYTPAQIYFLME